MASKKQSNPTPPAPVPQTTGYDVAGTWAGQPNYRCATCGFLTLNLRLMTAHVQAHQPAAAPNDAPAPLAFGQLPGVDLAASTPEPEPAPVSEPAFVEIGAADDGAAKAGETTGS